MAARLFLVQLLGPDAVNDTGFRRARRLVQKLMTIVHRADCAVFRLALQAELLLVQPPGQVLLVCVVQFVMPILEQFGADEVPNRWYE